MKKMHKDNIHLAIKLLLAVMLLMGIAAAPALSMGLNTGAGPWQWMRPPVQGASINDIEFTDANTGLGVGVGGTIMKTTDGGANWSSLPSSTNYNLWGVDFIDANNGWAVGDYGAIVHTTNGGATWSTQALPGGHVYDHLQDVSFVNSSVGVATGSGYAFYTINGGNTWTLATGVSTSHNLAGVQLGNAAGTVNGYAVGNSGAVYKTTNGGASWTQQTSNTASNLTDVHFFSDQYGFAVADAGTGQGIIIRTKDGGANWEACSSGLITKALYGVRVAGGNTLVAVGNGGTILRYQSSELFGSDTIDNIATALNAGTVSSGTTSNLMAVDFPTTSDGYASGAAGAITKGSTTTDPWSLKAGGNAVNLLGSDFVDADHGWLVGQDGIVIKTEDGGETWSTDATGIPSDVDLQDVDFVNATTGFAVGCQGAGCPGSGTSVAYKYSSGTWSAMTGAGTTTMLFGVHMTNATNGWAVGSNSTALRTTNGSSWTSDATGMPVNIEINDVDSISAASNAWAVGQDTGTNKGVILKWNGSSWSRYDPASAPTFLTAIDMVDTSTGYSVGNGGTIYKTGNGGTSWDAQTSGTSKLLADIGFSSADNGFAVGDEGRLIHTRDGGATWYAEDLGTNVFMYTISVLGERKAYVGGANGSVLRSLRPYYFTWYDDLYSSNWMLMANPASASQNVFFDLFIAGQQRDLSDSAEMYATLAPGGSITPEFTNVIGGPVNAASLGTDKAIVSQRVLWPKGGSSIEEVMGIDIDRLSDHYYWTWYDQLSPGFTNWVLIANPNPYTVDYKIKKAGVEISSGSIPTGQNVTPTFAGQMGGPIEVTATVTGSSAPAAVFASQRVLTGGGIAFNEAVGVPAGELTNDYYWPWYDDVGGQNWILIANPPDATGIYYQIFIAGNLVCDDTTCSNTNAQITPGAIAGGGSITPRFGLIDGPVEVKTFSDASHTTSADSIASQRILFGPSFGETMGYPAADLSTDYHWSWYDMVEAGMQNWVLIANPQDAAGPIDYEIKIGGTTVCSNVLCTADTSDTWQAGSLAPGERFTPTFRPLIGGPVEVITTGNAITSQRVLYNGYFNEVLGTVLD